MEKYLPCVVQSVLFLWDTHLYLTLDDGLGLTECFPIGDILNPVGLEEFDQTPTVVSTGSWRLVTNRARHLDILLWGAFNLGWGSRIRFGSPAADCSVYYTHCS